MKHIALLLFILAGLSDLAFIHFGLPYRVFSKPLIMISLIAYFAIEVRHWNSKAKLFLTALISSLLGDIFLIFDGKSLFIMGLLAFLVMQLIYAYLFYKQKNTNSGKVLMVCAGLLVYAILFNSYTWGRVGDLKVAVVCYTFAIAIMVLFGLLRDTKLPGYGLVATGVLLFMISDSSLALGKFAGGFPYSNLVVMGTYILAQFCIVLGYTKSLLNYKST